MILLALGFQDSIIPFSFSSLVTILDFVLIDSSIIIFKIFWLRLTILLALLSIIAFNFLEGTGSMGDDTALAVMSKMHRQIYDYFRQQFAQVTNPPIDSLREVSVMSLETCYGPELNIFDESPEHAKRLVTSSPFHQHLKY